MKISDLMKTQTGHKAFLSGIKIILLEFFRSFKKGIPLFPDEINLASQELLQCIEDALVTENINIILPFKKNLINENSLFINIFKK